MAGDPANTRVWQTADVYTAVLGTALPADTDTALIAAWKLIGLLDGDEGITEARDEDTDDKYAWGGTLVRTVHSHHKRSLSFTAFESNDNVHGLVNPGSAVPTVATTLRTSIVKVPVYTPFAMVLELTDGARKKRIASARVEIAEIGDREIAEQDLESWPVTVNLIPNASNVLYTELEKPYP